jgi:hypothetical protein
MSLILSPGGPSVASYHLARRPPTPRLVISTEGLPCPVLSSRPKASHAPSCHLDRRPPMPPLVISTEGLPRSLLSSRPEPPHAPSCHLDRRPPMPPLVISTEGRRPEWRDLAANESCPGVAPRPDGRTENRFGRESAFQIELRNIRGQMSRLRCASLDMTRRDPARLSKAGADTATVFPSRLHDPWAGARGWGLRVAASSPKDLGMARVWAARPHRGLPA